MTRNLEVDSQAAIYHDLGLAYANVSNFDMAHASFARGVDTLSATPERTLAVLTQEARIVRDSGFTALRWTLRDCADGVLEDRELQFRLSEAQHTLVEAYGLTLGAHLDGYVHRRNRIESDAASDQLREASVEHAATMGLMLRLRTAQRIVYPDLRDLPPLHNDPTYAEAAYELASQGGSSGSHAIATSIAMHEARSRRALGDSLREVAPWAGRAVHMAREALVAGDDARAPVAAIVRVGHDLVTPQAAMAAAINWRTV